jgi:hypothetical protein
MTEEETRELEEAEAIGRRFLAWDLDDETAMDQPPKEFVAEDFGHDERRLNKMDAWEGDTVIIDA